jgi:hypothetical protein
MKHARLRTLPWLNQSKVLALPISVFKMLTVRNWQIELG